jgi:hypothetical protein
MQWPNKKERQYNGQIKRRQYNGQIKRPNKKERQYNGQIKRREKTMAKEKGDNTMAK